MHAVTKCSDLWPWILWWYLVDLFCHFIEGLTNVKYACGKAEEVLPNITNNLKDSKDVIGIVDPPRAGLGE